MHPQPQAHVRNEARSPRDTQLLIDGVVVERQAEADSLALVDDEDEAPVIVALVATAALEGAGLDRSPLRDPEGGMTDQPG